MGRVPVKLTCPKCQAPVPAEDVNVATDLARCVRCDEVFKPSARMAADHTPENLDPPVGTLITFEEGADGGATFTIPRKGLKGTGVFLLVFATIWISFVAFWTFGAAQASILFALFSIPFWVVGIFLWRGILIGMTETQIIGIGRDALTLSSTSLLSSKEKSIPYAEIQSIRVEAFAPRDPFTMARHMKAVNSNAMRTGGLSLPTITHGTKKSRFAEGLSEPEMDWLVRMLKMIVMGKGA